MLKERLILVLKQVIEYLPKSSSFAGICDVLEYLEYKCEISSEERNYIIQLLKRNKPSIKNEYKKFTENPYWTKSKTVIGDCYWWNPMFEYEATIEIRAKYLKKLISNIK